MHVLITGARAPACLEWARAFHAAGWRISVGDSLSWPLTRASKAVDHYLRLPEPRNDVAAWSTALEQAVIRLGIDLILPTCEEAFYLSHAAHRLPCRVLTSDFALMHQLHHKGRFAALTQGWPVSAPESHLLSSPAAVEDFLCRVQQEATADGRLDWVLKPAYSRFASQTLIRPPAARLARLKPSAARPWVAQRFVAGREYCSFSLFTAGRLSAHACYHPRYRVGRGSGIWFEPGNPAPIRAFVERFGAETGYSGQVAFDYIEDRDGRCHVLECNPRATSGVHLFDDQPDALVNALLGADGVLTPSPTPRMVGLAMLLFAAPRHLFNAAFWQDYRCARDVIARPDDHGPLHAQIPGLFEIVGRALYRRCGLLAASTADIEWDGQPL